MRSRLEARWACYFDYLGIKWEYEKEGFDLGEAGKYLPDFWLPQVSMWAEVKPEVFSESEYHLCRALVDATGYSCLMLEGLPDNHSYWAIEPIRDDWPPEDDYILDGNFLHEGRFYSNTGAGRGCPEPCYNPSLLKAIEASRSARFEFGESGAEVQP